VKLKAPSRRGEAVASCFLNPTSFMPYRSEVSQPMWPVAGFTVIRRTLAAVAAGQLERTACGSKSSICQSISRQSAVFRWARTVTTAPYKSTATDDGHTRASAAQFVIRSRVELHESGGPCKQNPSDAAGPRGCRRCPTSEQKTNYSRLLGQRGAGQLKRIWTLVLEDGAK